MQNNIYAKYVISREYVSRICHFKRICYAEYVIKYDKYAKYAYAHPTLLKESGPASEFVGLTT